MATFNRNPPIRQADPQARRRRADADDQRHALRRDPDRPGPGQHAGPSAWSRTATRTRVYDVARTAAGLVDCDCPSYEATYRGNGLATCKHGQALVMVGLLEAPSVTNWSHPRLRPPARRVRRAGRRSTCGGFAMSSHPAPVPAPAFDLGWHLAMNAVVEKRAEWLTSRPADARHVEPAPCCDPVESMPCEACATVHAPLHTLPDDRRATTGRTTGADETGPAVGPDDEVDMRTWDPALDAEDDGPAAPAPIRLDFPAWIAYQAAEHRKIGGERHEWLAGEIAKLAEQARFLDATSPESFDVRTECMLDCAATEAEARLAAARRD